MQYRWLLLSLLLQCAHRAQAQDIPVTITVRNAMQLPVRGAVIRPEAPDSAAGTTTRTDSAGIAQLVLRPGVSYYTEIAATGYAPFAVQLQADSPGMRFTFTLQAARSLEGATVTARKSLMRQEEDKTVVDPAELAAAASNSYEVLEKVPGVIADQDGNFYIASATPATIYINGREMKMSSADLSAMLKSLPPDAILKIEVLRTPSSRYDASGSGGIINIVLKKGVKLGVTGSVNAGLQQTVYSTQFAGLSVNYGEGGRTAYLNLNYIRRKSLEHIETRRMLSADSLLYQESNSVYPSDNLFIGYGAGKSFGSHWELSYDGRVSGTFNNNRTENSSMLKDSAAGGLLNSNRTFTGNRSDAWNVDQSLALKYKIDTSGSEWTASLSWNGSFGRGGQDILVQSAKPLLDNIYNDGTIRTDRHYLAFQTDLRYRLRPWLTVEAGIKSTGNFFRHNSDYAITYNGLSVPDAGRSATYRYDESIHAAYIQAAKTIGQLIIKPGLRLEYTGMTGQQIRPGTSDFTLRRTDLFPYLYISRKVMTIAHFDLRAYLVYRRTILRPAYDYLNPFQRFLDPYLYETGNPSLRPQFTHNYEANISIDEHPLLAVGYNDMTDVFSNVVYQSDSNRSVAYRTYDNLGRNRETYIRGMGAIPPGGAYFFVLGGQYNISNYDGQYNGEPLRYRRESWTFFTYHTLKLGRNTNLSVNGFMRLNGLMQFYELGTFGMLNASISRYFLGRKLQVTLSAQDIFYTNRYDYRIDQGGVVATGARYNDSRRFGINLRYNFGIRPKEEKNDLMNMDADKASGR